MRARMLWIATLGLGLACGGGPDATALDTIAQAVRGVDPADQGRLLLAGLSEPGVGVVPDGCAFALHEAIVAGDPSMRALKVAEAFSGLCPDSCAQEAFAVIANVDPEQRDALILQTCDAAGPDPVFGAPALAALRPEMDSVDYLVARMLLEPTLAATEGSSTGREYAALVEGAAVSFAANRAPRVTAAEGAATALHTTPNLDRAAATAIVEGAALTCGWGTARLVLSPDGAVRAATRAPEGDGACVAEALSGAWFPASSDRGFAVVDVAWGGPAAPAAEIGLFGVIGEEGVSGFGGIGGIDRQVVEGAVPGRATGPAPVLTTGPAEVKEGSLSKEAITRVVRQHANQVRYCYQKLLVEQPAAAGRLEVAFVIGADGTVSSAATKSSTVPDELASCVVGRVQRWTFPAPDGGGVVAVTYPFTFAPG